MKKARGLKPSDLDKAIENMDTQLILKLQVRQVRWPYNNSNKCLMVYDEKLVRRLLQRLEYRINELERKI